MTAGGGLTATKRDEPCGDCGGDAFVVRDGDEIIARPCGCVDTHALGDAYTIWFRHLRNTLTTAMEAAHD